MNSVYKKKMRNVRKEIINLREELKYLSKYLQLYKQYGDRRTVYERTIALERFKAIEISLRYKKDKLKDYQRKMSQSYCA